MIREIDWPEYADGTPIEVGDVTYTEYHDEEGRHRWMLDDLACVAYIGVTDTARPYTEDGEEWKPCSDHRMTKDALRERIADCAKFDPDHAANLEWWVDRLL